MIFEVAGRRSGKVRHVYRYQVKEIAKAAKDVAAASVLICAIASVIVGCIVFLPYLIPLLSQLL